MATTEDEDEFKELGSRNGETLYPDDIEPGETVTGELHRVVTGVGDYEKGVAVMDVDGETRAFDITRGVVGDLLNNDVAPGDTVRFVRDSEEQSFSADDGEERTFHELSVMLKED
jgi:hypothetical protein